MKVYKRLKGEVEYNDGQFVEIQTVGTEGHEENILLETIQLRRCVKSRVAVTPTPTA